MHTTNVQKQSNGDFQADLGKIQDMLMACMQCGTCSASCPNVAAMDMTPRRMWRLVLLGMTDELFHSKSFWLCSACYTCTLRCPRGLPLTEAVYALKRLAGKSDDAAQQKHALFYKTFMNNIARDARIQEGRLISDYFLAGKNPFQALQYAPLGMSMMRKGKLKIPSFTPRKTLDELFHPGARGEEKL